MKDLLEKMEENQELKAKIEELNKNPSATAQDYIKVASEYGIELTEADFQPAQAQGELSDDELEAAAGGDRCICVLGGGGSAGNGSSEVCACVMAGWGNEGGGTRCYCPLAGEGNDPCQSIGY